MVFCGHFTMKWQSGSSKQVNSAILTLGAALGGGGLSYIELGGGGGGCTYKAGGTLPIKLITRICFLSKTVSGHIIPALRILGITGVRTLPQHWITGVRILNIGECCYTMTSEIISDQRPTPVLLCYEIH